MNKLIASLLLLCAAGLAGAQTWVDAEVRKVDKPQGKLTLRHGEIKNLDMPAMTMIFRVKDVKMLDGLVEGAKVRFVAEKRDGLITVMELQAAP
jgi:Cu(I)/Ag(I) efflux system periplasmic protein CusF